MKESIKIVGVFLLANMFIYGIGVFIAVDYNPLNWWLLSSPIGRIFVLIMEIMIIGKSIGSK